MINLELTPEEAQALLKFIDVGVRNGGLANAQAGVHLAGKIQAAGAMVSATDAVSAEAEEGDLD